MAILPQALRGIWRDGTLPRPDVAALAPTPQPLVWPVGEDGRIEISVVLPDGSAANILGCTLTMGVRKRAFDATPKISRQATITDGMLGLAYFPLGSLDTAGLSAGDYRFDVQLTLADGVTRVQVVPDSVLELAHVHARPGESVTAPASQLPLGQGPPGPAGAQFAWQGTVEGELEEVLVAAWRVQFGQLTPALLRLTLSAEATTEEAGAALRLYVGGTRQAIDGDLVLEIQVDSPVFTVAEGSAEILRPATAAWVKVTIVPAESGVCHADGLSLAVIGSST